ncbi:uncharacterized protein [Epargyreus clarus]|uniref:uncharacterized protein n=1 Tax=Epargyreus clarus TaxID=520877 RepID=UPI003C2E2459
MALKTSPKKVNTIKKSGKVKKGNKRNNLVAGFLKDKSNKIPEIAATAAPNCICGNVYKNCEYHQFASVYPVVKAMATYYPQYQLQRYTYPIMTEWSPIVSTVQTPTLYTAAVPVPVLLTTPQVVTQICPYTGALVSEPVLTSVIPNTVVTEIIPVVSNAYKPIVSYSNEQITAPLIDNVNKQSSIDAELMPEQITSDENVQIDPLEFYLTLPKELFPTARMFSLDPNPIIDEFCKMANISDNTSWILDLEFGIPRVPITRAIPVYDVQFNSIHCKNTPGAIHPGFESCSYDFKRVILFYYDCIISTWYKGYIIMNYDKSVKNFQSWLLLPMQIFGMCWP